MGGKEGKLLSSVAKSGKEDFEKKAKKLWEHVDKDSSGKLEEAEVIEFFGGLYEYLQKTNPPFITDYCKNMTKEEVIDLWFNHFDSDRNRVINWKEFQDILNFLSDPELVAKKMKKKNDNENKLKFMMCGDSNVGKTSLMNRFFDGVFDEDNVQGNDTEKVKEVKVRGEDVELKVYDTMGAERFRLMTASYFQECNGVILVFDLTVAGSLDRISIWIRQIERYRGHGTLCVLVGNKCDLKDLIQVSPESIQKFATENDMPYVEASAKDDINVTEVFLTLAYKMSGIKLETKTTSPSIDDTSSLQSETSSSKKRDRKSKNITSHTTEENPSLNQTDSKKRERKSKNSSLTTSSPEDSDSSKKRERKSKNMSSSSPPPEDNSLHQTDSKKRDRKSKNLSSTPAVEDNPLHQTDSKKRERKSKSSSPSTEDVPNQRKSRTPSTEEDENKKKEKRSHMTKSNPVEKPSSTSSKPSALGNSLKPPETSNRQALRKSSNREDK